MRRVINPQLQFGEQDISAIVLDPRSRDDIPQILRGLQYIYVTPEIRERVFAILAEVIPTRLGEDGAEDQADADTGRPGMDQWKILVLGTLRLGLNADHDRVQELANQHTTIRQMLGHGDWADDTCYPLQTLKDNLRLFTPEILDRINREVVGAGHRLVKKSPDDELHARVDSFVVKTDVHYPTDSNLLYDAVRKAIETTAGLCDDADLSDWRQSAHNVRQLKNAYRHVQRLRHSTSKDEDKRQARQEEIDAAYEAYLEQAEIYLARLRTTRITLRIGCALPEAFLTELDDYLVHAERQIDQIRRRVLQGETIPHEEKIFSIFEPHTEWIVKGKAGVPVELGLRVAIVEDQYRFILHHQVMEKTTDDKIAVAIVRETQERFPAVRVVSMDRAFTASPIKRRSRTCSIASCYRARASSRRRTRRSNPIPSSSACATGTRGSNRPSTPWKPMVWTSVPITASTASSATSRWRWWRATCSASAPSSSSARSSDCASRENGRPDQ